MNTTPHRIKLQELILKTAAKEFLTKGIRAVKMDDLSKMLGISKRTLYELYEDKETILMLIMQRSEENLNKKIFKIIEENQGDIMKIAIEFQKLQMAYFAKISSIFLEDLSRYDKVRSYVRNALLERSKKAIELFNAGVQQELFRKDANYEIVTEAARSALKALLLSDVFKRHQPEDIFKNVILLFFRGVCTKKGLEILDKADFSIPVTNNILE